jgi:hypothetical protein
MELDFLTPVGALLVAVAALVPVGMALRERRDARVRRTLGLDETPPRRVLVAAIGWLVAFGLLGAAAAQPVVRVERETQRRTDAEAYVLVDTTRSMLAATAPGEARRIDRAIEAAAEIRRALPDVPFGVASQTNRPLPHLFPSAAIDQFELVVTRAVGVNRPPPGRKRGPFEVATDFQSLEALATDNFFDPESRKRLVVLFSDGESGLYAPRFIAAGLAEGGVDLIVVRLWDARERVWRPDGSSEPDYRPIPESIGPLEHLAALTAGGRVYAPNETGAIVRAARRYLGEGPTASVGAPGRTVSLAPYAVLAACIPLAALLLPGLRSLAPPAPFRPHGKVAYNMLSRWRASSRHRASRSPAPRAPSPPSSFGRRSSTGGSSPGGG